MKLEPVTQRKEAPDYPERRWRKPTWLRRVANVVTLTAALALGAGCGGDWRPFDDDDDDDDWEEMAGAMPAPTFWCADEQPEWTETLWIPGDHWGELCGESTGWASIEVQSQGIYRLTLTSGVELVGIALLDPSGEQIAQLDGDMPTVTVELEPGTWVLAATAADPVAAGWGSFGLSIEQLGGD